MTPAQSGFFVEVVVLGHEKFRVAGAAAAWLWVQCGVWSAANGHDGFVNMTAVRAYGTLAQARKLVEVGLWEEVDGGFRFHQWRNGHPSPETAREEKLRTGRERSQRWRDRRRDALASRERHASVTHNAGRDARDAPLDTLLSPEVPPLDPPQGESPPAAPLPRTRGAAIPAGFALTPAMRAWAAEKVPGLDVETATEAFVAYWTGTGKPMKNWEMTWRNGMLRESQLGHYRRVQSAAAPAPAERKPWSYERGERAGL